jgi:hypothetical protein
VVECLPSKPEALSSNPSTAQNKNKQKTRAGVWLSGFTQRPGFYPKQLGGKKEKKKKR